MLRDVDISRLAVGMYVAELDRPWLETPFPLQGFYIRDVDDIAWLGKYCQFVRVDPRRFDFKLGKAAEEAANDQARQAGPPPPSLAARRKREQREQRMIDSHDYQDSATIELELTAARGALAESRERFDLIWRDLAARRRVAMAEIAHAVNPLVESVLRNKDALVTLLRVQRVDPNLHEHCIALAIWAGLLGRQLGLPPEQIRTLALGCSLVDIGQTRVSPDLFDRAEPLTPEETAEMQSHVAHSLDMLEASEEVPAAVYDIVRWHHERMDGSGYPDGLEGTAIPMFARVAGIVDSYESMVGPRRSGVARSSFESLVDIQESCPQKFQPELVERFARAIGLFPNGCLVELNTGEVAVVYSQNTGKRLRPRVMVILGPDKRKLDKLVIVDLSAADADELRITRELPAGEYGVDTREYFL
jgi:HD-GYP domain-containing protein (c-di-GMP phosphodiesterase class II)